MEPVASVLAHFGVAAGRVERAAETLHVQAPAVADRLPELVAAAADPAMALAGWEALVEASTDVAAVGGLGADELSGLFTLLGGSQVLAATLRGAGGGWVELFRQCWAAGSRAARDHQREIGRAASEPWEPFSERLRQVRHHEYLRIGLNDLAGRYPVDMTMTELSALAADRQLGRWGGLGLLASGGTCGGVTGAGRSLCEARSLLAVRRARR